MAQIFGERNRYLIWMDYVYHIASVVLFFMLFYLIYQYLKINVLTNPTWSSVIILALIYAPIFFWIKRQLEEYVGTGGKFKRGRAGEYDIFDELVKLSDDYMVFQDVKLPRHRDNIDFVVIGSTGFFILEVKSHRGRISFNGDDLLRNGWRFREKNILRQTMNEAMDLHTYLKKRMRRELFIVPILVFSSKWASMRFGFNKVKSVYVIQKRFLNELILKNTARLSLEDILLLKCELEQLVRAQKK